MMYSRSDEKGILDILEIKIKIKWFLWILHFGGGITVTFLKKEKKAKVMTVCFYHVTYAFQSESTLYSCLNVKELLARSRREI